MKKQSSPHADTVEWSRKPKTMNNGSKPLTENLFYVPQSLKTCSQKKTLTSLKTHKRIYNHFTPILNHACARAYLSQLGSALTLTCCVSSVVDRISASVNMIFFFVNIFHRKAMSMPELKQLR